MKFEILDNGNLKLIAEDGDREELQDRLDRAYHKDHGFLADLVVDYTGWAGNGMLYAVRPEDVPGALTDAPVLCDEVDYLDDGEVDVRGRVWWFPDYAVRSFAEELIADGSVVFTAAPLTTER